MALRLGCKLCQPHQCICRGIADIYGHHALSCARSKGRIPRHTSLSDIIKTSLTSCGIPSLLEPPDGLTGIRESDVDKWAILPQPLIEPDPVARTNSLISPKDPEPQACHRRLTDGSSFLSP
ncbi:hypothetical protein ANN_24592 [Periplaneta americana]|uniref:TAZ-type domain-containing protein n=1 Tax=Periplaneta americana TaxID=6978 RepID=A0ABQ8S3F7_PERAM|nr:hypothetical protein ANN_24592 [Periplaneta americana]